MIGIQLNKRSRFLIILAVLGLCLVFLWPSITWYGRTPKELQALALSSTERIRDHANSQAIETVTAIKKIAQADSKAKLGPEYDWLVKAAKKEYKRHGDKIPSEMTVSYVLNAFPGEIKFLDAVEAKYRDEILNAKKNYNNSVKLGLDLAGGMNIIVRADLDAAVEAKKADLISINKRLSEGEENTEAEPSANLEAPATNETTAADEEVLKSFDENDFKKEAMADVVQNLSERIDRYGLSSPVIRQQGSDRIYIEIPGSSQTEAVSALIMGKGLLNFRLSDMDATAKFNAYYKEHPTSTFNSAGELLRTELVPEGYEVLGQYKKDAYGLDQKDGYVVVSKEIALDGKYIKNADVATREGEIEVHFALDGEGARIFAEFTEKNKGKYLAIVSDNKVKQNAMIKDVITNGSISLTGSFTYDEATNIKKVLQSAWLQVPLEIESQQVIGASLGEVAIKQGIMAILLGLGLILVFMLIFYKASGINAIVAQVLNLYIMFSILSGFNLTLTLSSIAGMILTIGMAVDANVLIFERIKEELRAGKSRQAAISMGFSNAFLAILDSNITTFIAAFFLAELGTGAIQGFAISLAIGVVSSLFTALVVSRLIFDFDTDVLHAKKVSIGWGIKQ